MQKSIQTQQKSLRKAATHVLFSPRANSHQSTSQPASNDIRRIINYANESDRVFKENGDENQLKSLLIESCTPKIEYQLRERLVYIGAGGTWQIKSTLGLINALRVCCNHGEVFRKIQTRRLKSSNTRQTIALRWLRKANQGIAPISLKCTHNMCGWVSISSWCFFAVARNNVKEKCIEKSIKFRLSSATIAIVSRRWGEQKLAKCFRVCCSPCSFTLFVFIDMKGWKVCSIFCWCCAQKEKKSQARTASSLIQPRGGIITCCFCCSALSDTAK